MSAGVLAEIAYQPEWWDVLQSGFMQRAFAGGTIVAIAAGAVGYFVVVRRAAFAAHALAHIGFPGATAAALLGLPVTLGLAVFCVAGGLVIGALGERVAHRDVATGTVLSLATASGVLFSSLASRSTGTVTSVLFGNLLAISTEQLVTFAAFTVGVLVVLAIAGRPLLFASITPEIATSRGVPVRGLDVAFTLLVALVVTMSVQVVGTLLLFALVVTPAATALTLTARPGAVVAIATGAAVASVWAGLVAAAMFDLPPSFPIVVLSVAGWTAALVARRRRGRANLALA